MAWMEVNDGDVELEGFEGHGNVKVKGVIAME